MPSLPRDDGRRLHVEVEGDGPALVLLHGWSRSATDLAPLAARLAAAGLRVVRPDLRGHGGSDPGDFTLEALAADVEAAAAAFAPDGLVLCGWSLGGQVALHAAATRPALAARLRGLALLGATPRFTAGDGWPHGQPARAVEGLALRVRRAAGPALARFLADCFAPGELPGGPPAWLAAGPAPDLAAALAGLEVLATADLRGALPALALPALVLHGEADAICPADAGRALAGLLPRARLTTLPGAGHAPFVAREAEVAALLGGFAREASA